MLQLCLFLNREFCSYSLVSWIDYFNVYLIHRAVLEKYQEASANTEDGGVGSFVCPRVAHVTRLFHMLHCLLQGPIQNAVLTFKTLHAMGARLFEQTDYICPSHEVLKKRYVLALLPKSYIWWTQEMDLFCSGTYSVKLHPQSEIAAISADGTSRSPSNPGCVNRPVGHKGIVI